MLSRSNTRRASGSSPAVTSSPVRQHDVLDPVHRRAHQVGLQRQPVAVAADELHDRLGADLLQPDRDRQRRDVGVGGGVVGGVEGVDERAHRLELALDLGVAAAVDDRQLGGDDELAVAQLALKVRHPPPLGDLPVAAAEQVQPRRGALEAVVDRRADVVDVAAPQRQALRALVGLEPHAAHLGLDLAVAVGADPAAGPLRSVLGQVIGQVRPVSCRTHCPHI